MHNWVSKSNSTFFYYYFPPWTSLWRVLDELECCHDGGTSNWGFRSLQDMTLCRVSCSDCSEAIHEPFNLWHSIILWVQRNATVRTLNDCKRQGDALSPLLFNFVLECAFRRVQVNQDELKLNGTRQLLVYADDVNILGGSVHTIKENAEALVVASKEIGLEVNA